LDIAQELAKTPEIKNVQVPKLKIIAAVDTAAVLATHEGLFFIGTATLLTPQEFSIVAAVADRVCPAHEAFPSPTEMNVAERVDALLANAMPGLSVEIRQLLQVRQRVKHSNVRDVPALRKLHGGYSRQPVMPMQHIIACACAETKIINMLREFGQVIVEFVFLDELSRPGVDVNAAHARAKVDDVGS